MRRRQFIALMGASVTWPFVAIAQAGYSSHNAIAAQLNARKVATARGGRWTHVQARQIINRSATGK